MRARYTYILYADTVITQDLVSRFSAADPKVNIGVLEVAHSIFVRWKPLMATTALYTEINHVINTFGAPFFQLLAVRAALANLDYVCPLSRFDANTSSCE